MSRSNGGEGREANPKVCASIIGAPQTVTHFSYDRRQDASSRERQFRSSAPGADAARPRGAVHRLATTRTVVNFATVAGSPVPAELTALTLQL